MRAGVAAAALAALTLAVPAAAQPGAADVLRGAVATLNRGHGPEVRDYAFTLVHEGARTPVYVSRGDGGEWQVESTETSPLSSLMSMAVVWPTLVSADPSEDLLADEIDGARYLRREDVAGRPAHVVTAAFGAGGMGAEGVDSVMMYVDAENSRILRIFVAGTMPQEGGGFAGGGMRLTVDLLDHRETDGVPLPRQLRVRMGLDVSAMDAGERAQMTMGVSMLRAQLQGSDDPEAREMLATAELLGAVLSGEELDLPMTVEDVVVNGGRPAWLDEDGADGEGSR